ncbi:hypothetical protein C6A85_13215, partial [Mycobacterium sp. ITM-2017-0098]
PSSLDSTTALTEPTALKPGSNTIEVQDAEPTSNVLVWVSTLGLAASSPEYPHSRTLIGPGVGAGHQFLRGQDAALRVISAMS